MNSNSDMMRRLQIALNSKGMKILCNRSQFYSDQQKRPVTIYKVAQSIWDDSAGKYNHKTLFSSASQIQVVLFMRNLWFLINGKEIPSTNGLKGAEKFQASWDEFEENWNLSNNNNINREESGKDEG